MIREVVDVDYVRSNVARVCSRCGERIEVREVHAVVYMADDPNGGPVPPKRYHMRDVVCAPTVRP